MPRKGSGQAASGHVPAWDVASKSLRAFKKYFGSFLVSVPAVSGPPLCAERPRAAGLTPGSPGRDPALPFDPTELAKRSRCLSSAGTQSRIGF